MNVGIDLPKICVGAKDLRDFNETLKKEWIVTNGLGGYASSPVLGINTRKYHGLLVASFNPPVDRRVLLSKLDEEIVIEDDIHKIGSNEFKYGIHPKGDPFISDFLMNPFPTYKYDILNVQLQKTVFMVHNRNATVVSYRVFNPYENMVNILITPLVNSRHFHSITNSEHLNWIFNQKPFDQGVILEPSIPLSSLLLFSSCGRYLAEKSKWVKEIYFREDAHRGESCLDDVFQPGFFKIEVASKEIKRFHIIATAGITENEARGVFSLIPERGLKDIDALYNSELAHQQNLLMKFQKRYKNIPRDAWLKWLILATDTFIVKRKSTKTKSVIAGYPWFEDWGRDSLISLPGLTLVTGRFEDAKEILLTFKRYCNRGIIPNRFPDRAGDKPIYNTVDATLWYFHAVLQYLKYTGDFDFVKKELLDVLKGIIDNHVRGTLYNIHIDEDGLIAHGPQLTWMDAKVEDRIITPRMGKAVEIQALWYNSLKIMELLTQRFDEKGEAEKYSFLAEKAKNSFITKFWNPKKKCLFDAINGEQRDSSLRPNQVIVVMLDFSMLDKKRSKKVVEIVWKRLWGTYGLKTLPKGDSRYVGTYGGDRFHRDEAYHNGTVWPWLLGPFITAFLKVKNHEKHWRTFAFENFLKPLFLEEIFRAGLGTISEIFDGDSPHASRGCIAQAWSVAELLRAYVEDVLIQRSPYEHLISI